MLQLILSVATNYLYLVELLDALRNFHVNRFTSDTNFYYVSPISFRVPVYLLITRRVMREGNSRIFVYLFFFFLNLERITKGNRNFY